MSSPRICLCWGYSFVTLGLGSIPRQCLGWHPIVSMSLRILLHWVTLFKFTERPPFGRYSCVSGSLGNLMFTVKCAATFEINNYLTTYFSNMNLKIYYFLKNNIWSLEIYWFISFNFNTGTYKAIRGPNHDPWLLCICHPLLHPLSFTTRPKRHSLTVTSYASFRNTQLLTLINTEYFNYRLNRISLSKVPFFGTSSTRKVHLDPAHCGGKHHR